LCAFFRKKKARFLQNYRKLIADLAALDGEIYAQDLDKKFVVYHPSFGYFAAVYDLQQIPIEKEGKEPSAKELAALAKAAKGARVLITEPQFPQRSALFLAKRLGLGVVTIDPLAYDIPQTLRSLAKALGRE
jgi:zinc transport system substrate-binding protein